VTPDSALVAEAIQARHFTVAKRDVGDVHFVCLHSTEGPLGSSAKNVALWWGGKSSPQTSANYICGDDGVYQSVNEMDVAYAAGATGNHLGLHIELVGCRANSLGEWQAHPMTLDNAARLVADVCSRWNLPCVLLDSADLVSGRLGITTHEDVSKAWAQSTHTDCGRELADYIVTRAAMLCTPPSG
jgi:hypothetical protein